MTLPAVGTFDLNTGFVTVDSAEGVKLAARLLASSSSCCFFASAWRSLQLNFFDPDPELAVKRGGDGALSAACCSNLAKGLLSFLGVGRTTGV